MGMRLGMGSFNEKWPAMPYSKRSDLSQSLKFYFEESLQLRASQLRKYLTTLAGRAIAAEDGFWRRGGPGSVMKDHVQRGFDLMALAVNRVIGVDLYFAFRASSAGHGSLC
jgi:hypothetical protein